MRKSFRRVRLFQLSDLPRGFSCWVFLERDDTKTICESLLNEQLRSNIGQTVCDSGTFVKL